MYKKYSEVTFYDFYYRYIALSPYSAMRISPALFYSQFIEEDFLTEYLPHKFEDISREFLLRENVLGKINPPLMDIGTYFFDDRKNKTNRQFDVVTKDKNGYISYECKYSDSKIGASVIKEEEEQTTDLNIEFYKLGFISKRGFTSDVDKTKYCCYSLSDFYK